MLSALNSFNAVACDCSDAKPPPDLSVIRPKAEGGDPEAQVTLAVAYRDGLGVTHDAGLAVAWFQKAAVQNFPPALHGLGQMYGRGLGVPKSEREAVNWFQRAANQGYCPAQLVLAGKHRRGEGVEYDRIEAYKWYTLASGLTNRMVLNIRAFVANQMSKPEIAEAERRVAEFSKRPQLSARARPQRLN